MLRVQVMGIEDSVSRAPTRAERKQMYELLDGALNQGFLGLSTDALPFHYLANAPHKEKRIPTQWSDETELRELLGLVREKDRVWQATPDSHDRAKTLRRFAWTRKRGFGKPLRVSALVCLDFPPVPGLWRGMLAFAALMNSKLMGGKFHFQALSQNFRIWADGIVAPIFEELPSTRKLIEFEADDREGRRALLSDPAFAEEFKRDIALAVPATRPKFGNPTSFLLDPPKMFVDSCPVPEWNGTSMAALMRRVADYQSSGGKKGADSPREAKVLASFPPETKTLGEFLLHALRLFDTDFRWWTDIANTRREVADRILFDPNTMPGFNDSGAHITNMAFFDGNLVTLQRAQTYGLEKVAYAVKRLTRDPARFFGTRAGTLEIGAQADVILLDPQALARHDGNQSRRRIYSELLENDVLVNRSDGVVREVYISGARVWENGNRFTQALGKERLGKVLTFTPRKE
jgi:N-acyl-D-aspartate/D-glutamate deacylase